MVIWTLAFLFCVLCGGIAAILVNEQPLYWFLGGAMAGGLAAVIVVRSFEPPTVSLRDLARKPRVPSTPPPAPVLPPNSH